VRPLCPRRAGRDLECARTEDRGPAAHRGSIDEPRGKGRGPMSRPVLLPCFPCFPCCQDDCDPAECGYGKDDDGRDHGRHWVRPLFMTGFGAQYQVAWLRAGRRCQSPAALAGRRASYEAEAVRACITPSLMRRPGRRCARSGRACAPPGTPESGLRGESWLMNFGGAREADGREGALHGQTGAGGRAPDTPKKICRTPRQ
jgi:hypothetical protein